MSNLVESILQSYNNDNNLGVFGKKLLESIPDNDDVYSIDDSMGESIKYLRLLDNTSDLLWLDFYSWNNLPLPVRNKIINTIRVIEFQSVYMSYRDFLNIRSILNLVNNYSIYILKTGNCYRVVILGGPFDSIYEKDNKYLKLIKNIISDSIIDKFSTGGKR